MNNILLNKKQFAVYERMKSTGDYMLNISGRLWWANDNKAGALVEAGSSDEYQIIMQLKDLGIIEHCHRSIGSTLETDTGWVKVNS